MTDYTHITKMENILNTQTEKIEALQNILDFMEENTDRYQALVEYYYSEQREQDLEDGFPKHSIAAYCQRTAFTI